MASLNVSNGGIHPRGSPTQPTLASNPHDPNSAAYLAYPVKHVVSSLYRRMTEPPDQPISKLLDAPISPSGYHTPPKRRASPFSPPPLTPLTLASSVSLSRAVLNHSLAEEIRLLVPPRLQLVETWRLAYSLEVDGASLHTLFERCQRMAGRSQRAGYVLAVRDSSATASRALFGAYLSDPPRPSLHFYGTGECFLWKASVLSSSHFLQSTLKHHNSNNSIANGSGNIEPPSQYLLELAGLPPPPSADTTKLQRTTILRSETKSSTSLPLQNGQDQDLQRNQSLQPHQERKPGQKAKSEPGTPDRIRFKAFPYSGINDFMLYCETGYLSVGGGDGHYGLWLDDQLEHGISDPCPTFGNEPLSEEGHKFDILGLEVWYIGA